MAGRKENASDGKYWGVREGRRKEGMWQNNLIKSYIGFFCVGFICLFLNNHLFIFSLALHSIVGAQPSISSSQVELFCQELETLSC